MGWITVSRARGPDHDEVWNSVTHCRVTVPGRDMIGKIDADKGPTGTPRAGCRET
jgi:hypothetical protein